jgi:hypothetical protein
MKKLTALILFIVVFSVFIPSSFAAKKFVPKVATAYINAVQVKTKNVVRVNFSNLRSVKNISYMLTYTGSGVGQGVSGTLAPGKKVSLSRDLFLGTCSKNVCVKHTNAKNIKLKVTINYVNNTSSTKTYNIR